MLPSSAAERLQERNRSDQQRHVPGYQPHVFLWQRWWLWNGSLGTRANDFSDDMSSVIAAAYAAGLGQVVDGVGVIETQLESSADVLSHALVVAARINVDTASVIPGGWLTTHGLTFPGAANGAWFDDIDSQPASSTFFQDMSEQAAHFAFVFKDMPLEKNCTGSDDDNTLCASGMAASGNGVASAYPNDFVDCLYNNLALTKSAGNLGNFDCSNDSGKKAYLLAPSASGGIGLNALRTFVANDCGKHPNVTNVLFWGDSADGFSEMTAGNVRALHQALIDDAWSVPPGGACGASGYDVPYAMRANQLSHKAIVPTTPQGSDLLTHIFEFTGNALGENATLTQPKASTSYTTPLSVWQEWRAWSAATPTTCSTSTPCY